MTRDDVKAMNRSALLAGAGELMREQYESGDFFAPFAFAALYLQHDGEPTDVPGWVADSMMKVAGAYAAAKMNRGPNGRAKSFDEIAGLSSKRHWQRRRKAQVALQFREAFYSAVSRARAAVEAHGAAFEGRYQDGTRRPIPENAFGAVPIVDDDGSPTMKFQGELAKNFGFDPRRRSVTDEANYRLARELLKLARAILEAKPERQDGLADD